MNLIDNYEIDSFNEDIQVQKIGKPRYEIFDCHIHFDNFIGESMGLKKLVHFMKENNVSKAIVFGLPTKKIWLDNEKVKPEYYLDDDNYCYYDSSVDLVLARQYQELDKNEKEMIVPFLCGFNPLDKFATKYIDNMLNLFPGVFKGIGEIFYRHDDLTHLTVGEPPRMNTEATKNLVMYLSKKNLPFIVHNNISSPGINDYPKYLGELESILLEFPNLKLVLAHRGASRRINITGFDKIIGRLLREYKNFYIDLSWVVFDEVISNGATSFNDWIKLCEEFNTQVLLGSDLLGDSFHKIGKELSKYNSFLERLRVETKNNLCYKNGLSLLGK